MTRRVLDSWSQPLALTTARSDDGRVEFQLSSNSLGLQVERVCIDARGGRISQLLQFADSDSFHRWCDASGLSASEPHLFDRLMRASLVACAQS